VDNLEIARKRLAEQVTAELRSRPVAALNLALVQYCLELTILARCYFLENKLELAEQCNESIHRILGYVGTELRNKANAGQKDSMIDLVVQSAAQKGWLQILRCALERSTVPGSDAS
jgi:hypothetical protein